MREDQKFPIITLIVLGLILILVLVIPVKVPYGIQTKGYMLPEREWYLERTRDGSLLSTMKNHRLDKVDAFHITEFQRGDVAGFRLMFKDRNPDFIHSGDTIGLLFSNEELRRLHLLEGQLKEYEAELSYYLSGSKPEEVEEALSRINLARQELEADELTLKRSQPLIDDSLIAPHEYDMIFQRVEARKRTLEIAEANYRKLTSGAKPEQIEWTRAKISTTENQIQVLNKRLEQFTITAPFSGAVHPHRVTNVNHMPILSVADTSVLVVTMPVDVIEREFITIGAEVTARIPGIPEKPKGQVVHVEPGVHRLDGRQVFFVRAVFPSTEHHLMPGLLADVTIHSESVTPREYLFRSARLMFNQ